MDHDAGSFNIVFDLTNLGDDPGDLDWIASTTTGTDITFNNNASSISANTTKTITATVTFPNTIGQNVSGVINVTKEGDTTYVTLSFSV